MAQICREARVANGTFYQYFSDKFDAFAEIVRALSRHLHQELQKAAQKVIRYVEAHGGEGKFIRKE